MDGRSMTSLMLLAACLASTATMVFALWLFARDTVAHGLARALLLSGSAAACASYIAFLYSITPGSPGFGRVFLRGGFMALLALALFVGALVASRATLGEVSRRLFFRKRPERPG